MLVIKKTEHQCKQYLFQEKVKVMFVLLWATKGGQGHYAWILLHSNIVHHHLT